MRLDAQHWLGREIEVRIDRPLGSAHPRYPDIIYSLNYGEVPGTHAADGHPVDVYVLGPEAPIQQCTGRVIAIVHRLDDIEYKLVVATSLEGAWPAETISHAVSFQE